MIGVMNVMKIYVRNSKKYCVTLHYDKCYDILWYKKNVIFFTIDCDEYYNQLRNIIYERIIYHICKDVYYSISLVMIWYKYRATYLTSVVNYFFLILSSFCPLYFLYWKTLHIRNLSPLKYMLLYHFSP